MIRAKAYIISSFFLSLTKIKIKFKPNLGYGKNFICILIVIKFNFTKETILKFF